MYQRSVWAVWMLACVITAAPGQTTDHFDQPKSWLERNYRHADLSNMIAQPRPEPAAQLAEIQSTLMAMLRRANFAGDLPAALAAAWQARLNIETPNQAPVIYLIAFKDGSIRSASAYWAEENTLHYITTEHRRERAPLDSVDRDLSRRLNRERNIDFQLPEL